MDNTQLEQRLLAMGEKYLPLMASESSEASRENHWVAPASVDENGEVIINENWKCEGGDVYEVIQTHGRLLSMTGDYLALHTVGWACPLIDGQEPDVPPSQHPDRVRVALLCLVGRDGVFGSVVRIGDQELMTELDSRGNLRDEALAMFGQ
jgi:hypothetical protein